MMFGRLGLHSIHLRLELIMTAAAPLVLGPFRLENRGKVSSFSFARGRPGPDMPNKLLGEGDPSATLVLRILGEH